MHGYGASARVRACLTLVPFLAALVVSALAPAPTAGADSIVRPVAADPSVIRADDGTEDGAVYARQSVLMP